MKRVLKYLVILTVALFGFSCQKDDGNPAFAEDELYIYENVGESYNIKAGDEFTLNMTVSPNDGSVDCVWKLDGIQISDGNSIVYVFVNSGTYQMSFEATRGGRTIKKYFSINVTD